MSDDRMQLHAPVETAEATPKPGGPDDAEKACQPTKRPLPGGPSSPPQHGTVEAWDRQAGILRSIMENISDGLVVADETGRFIVFNPAAERILGIGLTDTAPNQWAERYGCYLPDGVTPCPTEQLPLVRAIHGETVTEAELFIRNSQTPEGVWLSVNAQPLLDEQGRAGGGVAVFRDVSARRRADQRMAAQHAVTRVLAEAATLAEATPKILEAICHTLDWLVGAIWEVDRAINCLTCVEFWHQPGVGVEEFEVATRRTCFVRGVGLPGRVWQSGQPTWIPDVTVDSNFPRSGFALRSGLRGAFGFPLHLKGEVLGVIEFFSRELRRPDQDLLEMMAAIGSQIGQYIERKRAEEALRDSEALYHSLVESLPLHIFRKDLEERFSFGNHLFCAALGRPLPEIVGKSDFDFYPPELAEKYRRDDLRVLETGLTFEGVEENCKPDGTRTYVQVLKTPIHDARGQVVGTQGIFWDVTDRKRAEEDLRRTAEELARSNRDLEQFAYVASHDLQEPLRMVASYCQLLQRRYRGKLDADADDFLSYAVDGATRLQGLINDLLAYSRVGSKGKPLEPTGCTDVLSRALDNLQMAIDDSHAVVTSDELPTVLADETQLVQLFQNLIGNAIKFRGAQPPRVHVSFQQRGEEGIFCVRDNGIGIDARFFDRIFVIFQRLHGRGEYTGTGIGLALCKRIVERHGGRIWVESEPGKGCAFFFALGQGGG